MGGILLTVTRFMAQFGLLSAIMSLADAIRSLFETAAPARKKRNPVVWARDSPVAVAHLKNKWRIDTTLGNAPDQLGVSPHVFRRERVVVLDAGKYTFQVNAFTAQGMSVDVIAAVVLSKLERDWRSNDFDVVVVLDGPHATKDKLKSGARYDAARTDEERDKGTTFAHSFKVALEECAIARRLDNMLFIVAQQDAEACVAAQVRLLRNNHGINAVAASGDHDLLGLLPDHNVLLLAPRSTLPHRLTTYYDVVSYVLETQLQPLNNGVSDAFVAAFHCASVLVRDSDFGGQLHCLSTRQMAITLAKCGAQVWSLVGQNPLEFLARVLEQVYPQTPDVCGALSYLNTSPDEAMDRVLAFSGAFDRVGAASTARVAIPLQGNATPYETLFKKGKNLAWHAWRNPEPARVRLAGQMAAAAAFSLPPFGAGGAPFVRVCVKLTCKGETHRVVVSCDSRVARDVLQAMREAAEGLEFQDMTDGLFEAEARIREDRGTYSDLTTLATEDAFLARNEVRDSDEPGVAIDVQSLPLNVSVTPQGPVVSIVLCYDPFHQVVLRVDTDREVRAVLDAVQPYVLECRMRMEKFKLSELRAAKLRVDAGQGSADDFRFVALAEVNAVLRELDDGAPAVRFARLPCGSVDPPFSGVHYYEHNKHFRFLTDFERHSVSVEVRTVAEAEAAEAVFLKYRNRFVEEQQQIRTAELEQAKEAIRSGRGAPRDYMLAARFEAHKKRDEVREAGGPVTMMCDVPPSDWPKLTHRSQDGLFHVSTDFARGLCAKVEVITLAEAEAVSRVLQEFLGQLRAQKSEQSDLTLQEAQMRFDSGEAQEDDYILLARRDAKNRVEELANSNQVTKIRYERGQTAPKIKSVSWNSQTNRIEFKGTVAKKTLVQPVTTVEEAKAVQSVVDLYHEKYKEKFGKRKRRKQDELL